MKVYVISDIHGSYSDLEKFLDIIKDEEYDNLFILGDILHGYGYSHNTDVLQIGHLLSKVVTRLVLIKGNCDLPEDTKYLPTGFREAVHIMFKNRNLYFIHGHRYFPFGILKENDILCHGHTHINHITLDEEKKFIECCPGSIALPRANTEKTYMEINDSAIIIYNFQKEIIEKYEL